MRTFRTSLCLLSLSLTFACSSSMPGANSGNGGNGVNGGNGANGGTAPTPSISSISPSTIAAGSADVTITINGSNFGHYGHFIWSTAFWTTNGNLHDTGTWLQTSIISDSQLTAVIPAKLLQDPGSVQIVVMNGDIMGMSDGFFGYPRSSLVSFTVTP